MRSVKVLAILAVVFITACEKEVKPRSGSLGVEAATVSVAKAYENEQLDHWIADAVPGQYLYYRENMQIEFNPVMRLGERRIEMVSKTETETEIEFVMREDLWSWNFNGELIDEKHSEYPLTAAKSTSFTLQSAFQTFVPFADVTPASCDGITETDDNGWTYDCVRYFNLEAGFRRVPPPPAVSERENCGGLPDCLMDIHHLQFDRVLWNSGVVRRVTITRDVALDLPDLLYMNIEGDIYYSPPMYSECVREPYVIEGKSLRVTQCRLLLDFK